MGAINCIKHRDLCHSVKVHSYPSLVAVNWPGAPQGTPEEPAINMFKYGSNSFEETMTNIKTAFPGLVEVRAPGQGVEEGNVDLSVGAGTGRVGEAVWRTRVAPCALRLEDAAVSVRWILKYDVFTQGLRLSDKRMGECVRAWRMTSLLEARCEEVVASWCDTGSNLSSDQKR